MRRGVIIATSAAIAKIAIDYVTTQQAIVVRPTIQSQLQEYVSERDVTWDEIDRMREIYDPEPLWLHWQHCNRGCNQCKEDRIRRLSVLLNHINKWAKMTTLEKLVSVPPVRVWFQ